MPETETPEAGWEAVGPPPELVGPKPPLTQEQKAARLAELKSYGKKKQVGFKDSVGQPSSSAVLDSRAKQLEGVYGVLSRFKGRVAGGAKENVGRRIQHFQKIAGLRVELGKHKAGSPGYNAVYNQLNNAIVESAVATNPRRLAQQYRSYNDQTGKMELGAGGSIEAHMADIMPDLAAGKDPKRFSYSRSNIDLNASDDELEAMAIAMGRTDDVREYRRLLLEGDKNPRQAFVGSHTMSVPGLNLFMRPLLNDSNKGKFRPNDFIKRLQGYEEYDQSALAPPIPTQNKFRSNYKSVLAREQGKRDAFLVGPRPQGQELSPEAYTRGVSDTIYDFGIPAMRALREQSDLTSALKADGQLADYRNDQAPIILAGNEMFANVAEGSGPSRSVQSAPNLTDVEDGDGSSMMLQGNYLDDLNRDRSAVAADRSAQAFVKDSGPAFRSFVDQWVADNQEKVARLGGPNDVAVAALGDYLKQFSSPETVVTPGSPFASRYNYFDENTGRIRSYSPEEVPGRLRGDYLNTAIGSANEALASLSDGTFERKLSNSLAGNIQLGTIADLNRKRADFEAYGRASDAIRAKMIAADERLAQKIANGEPLTDEDTRNTSLRIDGEEESYWNAADALAATTAAQYRDSKEFYRKVYGRNYDEDVDRTVALSPEEEARQIAYMNDVDGDDGYREQVRIFGSPQENFAALVRSARGVSPNVTEIDSGDWDSVRKAGLMSNKSIAVVSTRRFNPDTDSKLIDTVNDDGTRNSLIAGFELDGGLLDDDAASYLVDQLLDAGYHAAFDKTNRDIEVVKPNGRHYEEWLGSLDDFFTREAGTPIRDGGLGTLRLEMGSVYTHEDQEYSADLSQRNKGRKVRTASGQGSRIRRA